MATPLWSLLTVIMMQKQTIVITSEQQFKVCQNVSWCNNPENHLVRTLVCVCVCDTFWMKVSDIQQMFVTSTSKNDTGKIPCSLFAKGAMLFLLFLCTKNLTK